MSLVVVDVSLGSKVVTLPLISQVPGRIITLKDNGSASLTNIATIVPGVGHTFESGNASYLFNTPFAYITLIGNSTNLTWRVLGTTYAISPPINSSQNTTGSGTLAPVTLTVNTLSVTGVTTLSNVSTIGQAAFYSSLQVQGGLSVFSTLGAYGLALQSNATIGGSLRITGVTTLSNSVTLGNSGGGNYWINDINSTGRVGFSNSGGSYGNGYSQYNAPSGQGHQWNTALTQTMILDNSGNLTATGNVSAYSDIRKKNNIVTIDTALDKIQKLRGVYYERKDSPGRQVGLIAQEVEEVLPEVVMTDTSSDKFKSVAYANIVGLLIEGIKELASKVAEQDSTIKGL
jgi:hypothetical protein